MNPYLQLVMENARLVQEGRSLPRGGMSPAPRPVVAADAPRVLIFAPHPDDECLVGALPLRLLRQGGMRVEAVAVTQGSNKERQAPRLEELRGACGYLGFEVLTTAPGGLERIDPRSRTQDHHHWNACVEVVADILGRARPRLVFFPHAGDGIRTHIGTHLLLVDALVRLEGSLDCLLVETEYWAAMRAPNLIVESNVEDVADLVAATSFHAGEVQHNPYHLRLPGWLQDNVRRGGQLIAGPGRAAPGFTFGTLYGVRRWRDGKLQPAYAGGRVLPAGEDPTAFLRAI